MNLEIKKAFFKSFPKIKENVVLAPLTTFQLGGPADLYYELTVMEELSELIKVAKKLHVPFLILGGGSNIIFSEKGFRGLVIHMKSKNITLDKNIIIADSGALLSQVVQTALKNNLSGMERFMGLPGTVGGAIRGNAGAFGTEIKDVLWEADIFSFSKGVQHVSADYFEFGYRESKIKHSSDLVLKGYFKLVSKDCSEALKQTLEILKSRAGSQPSGRCSGSFFKNPDPNNPKMKAGYLLDQAGCKNLKVGEAQVSEKHANWIMNNGNASFDDVFELSKLLQKKVFERFQIILEREVQLVNEFGFCN